MNTARRVATAVAVVLGVAGGVTTARIAPGSTPGLAPTADFNDPRRLGIPLVSPGCNDEAAVLVIGGGDNSSGLKPIVQDNSGRDLHYLRTDESCATKWSEDKDEPDYVIYRGPFEDAAEPCRDRMAGEDPTQQVTRLAEGNRQWVNCGCELGATELQGVLPPSRLDDDTVQANGVTVRLLQEMLNRLDESTGSETRKLTGSYDNATLKRVIAFQTAKQILSEDGSAPDGGVGERTWKALREAACGLYENDQDG